MMSKMRFVDLHCDTVACEVYRSCGKKNLRSNDCHLDLLRMREGGSLLQCFALYIPTPAHDAATGEEIGPWEYFEKTADCFDAEMAKNADLITQVRCYADIEKNIAEGKMSAMLTVEDGVPLEGKLERLDAMYARGMRLITLTWNHENSLGFPNKTAPDKGLKPFGIEALARMNELGIIADSSHMSDAGFWDLVKYSKKPFVASHSDAKALCNIYRNLTDDMLRALAEKGGVTGLNFEAAFLVEGTNYTRVEDLVRHARHIADVAGVETVALGSDFDGISAELEFKDCAGLPMLEEGLNKAFTAREVDLITHGNALRVIKDCIG